MAPMELWIIIAIGAAFFQNLRSVLQKSLKAQLSNGSATAARFIFAAPLAAVIVVSLSVHRGASPPAPGNVFFFYGILGALAQISATALLLHLFSLRNFVVGTIFSKTETIQSVLIGFVLLSDTLSGSAILAIAISMSGLILLSLPENGFSQRSWIDKSALLGLASGACFAISGVSYRAASLSLPSGDFLIRASLTLCFVTALQALLMLAFLKLREPGQISRLFKAWRISALAGIAGCLGSLGWFAAMTLQQAALVKAVGQIEIVFSFAASLFFFRESIRGREIVGISLISLGILLLVLIDV